MCAVSSGVVKRRTRPPDRRDLDELYPDPSPPGPPRSLHVAGGRGALRPDHRQEGQPGHAGAVRRAAAGEMAALDPNGSSSSSGRSGAHQGPQPLHCPPDHRRRWRAPSRLGVPRVAGRSGPQDRHRGDVPGLRRAGVPVDTHIHRLAARWACRTVRTSSTPSATSRRSSPRHWNRLHLQIIFFGREHCPALRHKPDECPICSWAATRTADLATSRAADSHVRHVARGLVVLEHEVPPVEAVPAAVRDDVARSIPGAVLRAAGVSRKQRPPQSMHVISRSGSSMRPSMPGIVWRPSLEWDASLLVNCGVVGSKPRPASILGRPPTWYTRPCSTPSPAST